MKRPTLEDIIMLHDEIVAQSGGSEGIRDINLSEKIDCNDLLNWIKGHVS